MCPIEDGELLTCGKGTFGRLGTGDEENQYTPIPVMNQIVDVVCGAVWTACINAKGELYTFGYGGWATLGHDSYLDVYSPRKVEALSGERIVQISCGAGHALALGASGSVYSWGRGDNFRLAQGDDRARFVPLQVMPLSSVKNVRSVHCLGFGSAVLLHDGSAIVWGGNQNGELGIGHRNDQYIPETLQLEGERIVDISCGITHMALLTESGNVFTQGASIWGQTGHGTDDAVIRPKLVQPPVGAEGKAPASIVCGGSQTFVIYEDGRVWGCGMNRDYQLGLSGRSPWSPVWIELNDNGNARSRILSFSTGAAHSLCALED
eukprot:c19415_g1_i1.p1 GENE.c19415_g1_i1~~c19415_g1_i1.p1  ORF type:complete len:321 (-),score=55.43 c19415_g1_i1:38-1000(-)